MTIDECKAIKTRISKVLLQPNGSKNIFGVGVSRNKERQPIIRVYVDNSKEPTLNRELERSFGAKIPQDVVLDFIQTQRPIFAACEARSGKYTWGGMSIWSNIPNSNEGTIGYFFKHENKTVLLSNNHVIAAFNKGIINATSIMREVSENFATLKKLVELKSLVNPNKYFENEIDAAIATINQGQNPTLKMSHIKKHISSLFYESNIVAFQTKVSKHGLKTCYTNGVIDDEWCDFILKEKNQYYKFINQMRIIPSEKKPFAGLGDSGSLIFETNSHKAVGLLFAIGDANDFPNSIDKPANALSGSQYAIMNRMGRVMNMLELSFVQSQTNS